MTPTQAGHYLRGLGAAASLDRAYPASVRSRVEPLGATNTLVEAHDPQVG